MKKQIELPETYIIKSTSEIKTGMKFCYLGPESMFKPDIGSVWEIKNDSDIMRISIAIIEDGQIWRPIKVGK